MSDDETVHKVEDILAGRGATVVLGPNQQITEFMILAKAADFERGGTALVVGVSPGLDWIDQYGLVRAFEASADNEPEPQP